jgi:O-antigen/teichoic acid export membrane protein
MALATSAESANGQVASVDDDAHPPPLAQSSRPAVSMARGALSLLSTQPLTWTASLLGAVLVPRYLGDQGLGQYTIAITLANLGGLIASLGVPNYLRRQIARQPGEVTRVGSTALALALLCASTVAIVVLGGEWLRAGGAAPASVLTVALIGMVVAAPQAVLFSLFVGQERHARFAWLNAGTVVASAAAGLGVLVLGGDLIAFMVAGLATSAIITLCGWRSASFRLDPTAVAPRLLLALARCGLPFLGWNVALQIYGEVDKLLLGALAQDAVVGWYAAAYRIVGIPVFIPTLLVTPLLPVLARCADDLVLARRTLTRTAFVALVLTTPLCGIIIATAPVIPNLLGWPAPFANAVPLLMILALHIPVVAVDMVLGTALMALGRERKWLVVGILAAVFNPALNLVLIPYCERQFGNGAIGAATVTVLTELVMLAGALTLMPKDLVDRALVGSAARITLAALCLLGVTATLLYVALPLAVAGGGVVYVAALLVLGVVSPAEIGAVWRLALDALGRRAR